MVTITDGANVLCVTNGAYKSQYEPFGWRIVPQGQDVELPRVAEDREIKKAEKLKNEAKKEENAPIEIKTEVADDIEYQVDKPLAEMTSKELKAKAEELGIDISGFETKNQVRKAIAAAIRGQNGNKELRGYEANFA